MPLVVGGIHDSATVVPITLAVNVVGGPGGAIAAAIRVPRLGVGQVVVGAGHSAMTTP